jgi:beta-galactosidase/beta-glucuronidase
MLRRDAWTSLDGPWAFALDAAAAWRAPDEARFDRTIQVPVAPETRRSGIGDTGLYRACWYRRELTAPEIGPDEQLLLHFGAVDYECSVWMDGALLGRHEGGYTPFRLELPARPGARTITVRAEDDPADLGKPRGKQDWKLHPHSIWYPRTTGIWQSVWLERVPRTRIDAIRWTPNLERWEIELDARVLATDGERLWLVVRLRTGDVTLVDDAYVVVAGEVHRRIGLSDPGIDDSRNELLWSPERPTLIEADLELQDESGRVLDAVRSYTALRAVAIDGDRFVLNGRPYKLRMVLDQGYWPETGMTPPDVAALRRDVVLTKSMGFNGARKHQKIEDPRYLYWADHLGLLVWAEMPSAYRFTRRSVERLTREWTEVVERDASHPCIVAWVPFNESWGVPNLPENKPERHYVEALYHLTRTLDPTRPVIGNDGWESVATDLVGIHDYDGDPARIAARYAAHDLLPRILARERPGGRALVLDHGRHRADLPVVLSEFGGIALGAHEQTWGYSRARTPGELRTRYVQLLEVVRSLELFAGFCYTQLADTYQEANGLLYADRTPKVPIDVIAAATRGPGGAAGETERPSEAPLRPADENVTERNGAPR